MYSDKQQMNPWCNGSLWKSSRLLMLMHAFLSSFQSSKIQKLCHLVRYIHSWKLSRLLHSNCLFMCHTWSCEQNVANACQFIIDPTMCQEVHMRRARRIKGVLLSLKSTHPDCILEACLVQATLPIMTIFSLPPYNSLSSTFVASVEKDNMDFAEPKAAQCQILHGSIFFSELCPTSIWGHSLLLVFSRSPFQSLTHFLGSLI